MNANALYAEFAGLTMLPAQRYLRTMELLIGSELPDGAITEFGVWKGGVSLSMMKIFGASRRYQFFDSFEGLPKLGAEDGEDAAWWDAHRDHPRYFDRCRADSSHLREGIEERKMGHYDVEIVEGWFDETVKRSIAPTIALAHIDCDWYDSVKLVLDLVWDRMQPGGLMVIDDYYDWEGCRKAVHDVLSERRARESIDFIGEGCGVVIRRRGSWSLAESPHLL